ncbi:sacsin N-terminal ATP-binding-like domain-containing protein [Candidatus Methanodesulfokora washburnensis]|jgi:hypothetical protein|uniref:DUF3883 domain-containing protein n=1 Tax=Candidatus Methanodesulfokora washburnensis TaxID=2478471 RepID=A0A429GVE7_9CREN|nr:DUF3883 domain-containing protein [Candidatus Methanodesulfokores washburnensis]RSN77723.1 DUF3883 domain-containing protein [Candidatus Methanodesulfokores washburnensis]
MSKKLIAMRNKVDTISEEEAYNHITEIQKSYTAGKNRVLDSLAGAMWIVEKMFARTGHFILEFIQNAEDAKATKVKVILQKGLVKILNNGAPFSRDDVEAICSVGKSHKDPKEHIGYLGVGFKAIFLVSSNPHIYSKPYRFKFDKSHWPDPRTVPWQITPIWLEKVPEECKEWNVVFHIPVDEAGYERIKEELQRLAPTTLLFLHNITEIELEFEDKKKIFRRKEKKEGIYTLEVMENGSKTVTSWVVFRNIIKVPDNIKEDRFTKEWNRGEVEKREIAVAFKLDDKGDLAPTTGTIKFGVFSYVPLREEEIGIPFLIHADFLVAPGREMVQREAPWNLWMLDEITKFIINNVISSFKAHDTWKYSYTNVLYSIVHHSPFDTHLANPINNEIKNGNHAVTLKGDFARISEVVEVSQTVLDLVGSDFIEKVTNKKVLHPKAKLHPSLEKRKTIDIRNLKEYLYDIESIKTAFGDRWKEVFRDYLKTLASDWFRYAQSTRESEKYQREFRMATCLIDEEGNICEPGDIYIATSEVEEKAKKLFPGKFKFLDPLLREDIIINFLKEIKVEELSEEKLEGIIKKEQFPSLLKELKDSSKDDQTKIKIVKIIKDFWKEGIVNSEDITKEGFLIRTKNGRWLEPQKVLLSAEYEPENNVERLVMNNLLDFELEFVDPIFIENESPEEKSAWKRFLEELKVGSKVDENRLVERVGILTSVKYEKEECKVENIRVLTESERGKGYDIESRMPDGSPKYIEVKASKGLWSINLTKNEYKFILDNPNNSFIYIVAFALKDPELYIMRGASLRDATISSITLAENEWMRICEKVWKPLLRSS